MFLIDHDQPKILIGQKQSRARTNHQLRITLPHHAPTAATFGHGDAGMPFRRLHPETRFNTVDKFP